MEAWLEQLGGDPRPPHRRGCPRARSTTQFSTRPTISWTASRCPGSVPARCRKRCSFSASGSSVSTRRPSSPTSRAGSGMPREDERRPADPAPEFDYELHDRRQRRVEVPEPSSQFRGPCRARRLDEARGAEARGRGRRHLRRRRARRPPADPGRRSRPCTGSVSPVMATSPSWTSSRKPVRVSATSRPGRDRWRPAAHRRSVRRRDPLPVRVIGKAARTSNGSCPTIRPAPRR